MNEKDGGFLGTFRPLRLPVFRRVWLAALVSNTGDWMQITGRAYLVYALTGSTAALGTVYFFSYSPQLLFSLTGGTLADRWDRRRLVVLGNLAQLVLAVLLGLLAATGNATVWNLALVSFLAGSAQAIVLPPTLALLPALVPREELHGAMSLNGSTYSASRVFGPLAAGGIIAGWGVSWVFAVNALTFLTVVAVWWWVPLPPRAPAPAPGARSATLEGLTYVRSRPSLAVPVVVIAVLSLIGFVYQPLAVAYATDVLARGSEALGATHYSLLQTAMGVGSVLGILGLAEAGRRWPVGTALAGLAAYAVALTGLGQARTLAPALVLGGLVAALHMGEFVLLQTLVQRETPEELRGRVMSILLLVWIGLLPFCSYLGGLVAAAIGVPATLTAAGAICAFLAVAVWPWRHALPTGAPPALEVAR